MNKFVIAAIIVAVISLVVTVTAAHPVYFIGGIIVAAFMAIWGLGAMEEEGLL